MVAISVDKAILFLKVTGTNLPFLFLASGSFGKSLACSCRTQISASVFAWLSSLLINTPVIGSMISSQGLS